MSAKPIRITVPVEGSDIILAESAVSIHLLETLLHGDVRTERPDVHETTPDIGQTGLNLDCPVSPFLGWSL